MNERACLSHVHQKKHRLFGSPSCSDRGKTKKRSQKISFLCNFKHLPHVQAYLGPSNTSVDFVSLFCCLFLAPSIFGPIFRSSSGRDIWNAACLLSPFPKFNKATQMFKCLVDTTPWETAFLKNSAFYLFAFEGTITVQGGINCTLVAGTWSETKKMYHGGSFFWNWQMMMCRLRIQKLKIGHWGDFEKIDLFSFFLMRKRLSSGQKWFLRP